jgi:hypothetical protein
VGTTTVACTVADAANNERRGSFPVAVVDTLGPEMTLLGAPTAEATNERGAFVRARIHAADRVDGRVAATCSRRLPGAFPLGETTVTCSAEDESKNPTTQAFTIVVEDTTGPVLRLPAGRVVEATGRTGATVDFTVAATDRVSGPVKPTCTPPAGPFPLATTTVTCSATDARNNASTGTFSITVRDTTAPSLPILRNLSVRSTSEAGARVSWFPTARDVVDRVVPLECRPARGSTFPAGTTTRVRCTATDRAGNRARPTFFTVTVSSWSDVD